MKWIEWPVAEISLFEIFQTRSWLVGGRSSILKLISYHHIGKLDRFLNRCRKLYRCQQLNQDISELFNLADRALFSSLQKNSHHVLHRLLPAKSTQPYNLRGRRHSFFLTQKQSSYDDCNFITRMLFYHIYWLNYFLALPRIYNCSTVRRVIRDY